MTGFYLTLLAVLLAGLGGRDQLTVAGLSAAQGPRPGMLIVGIAVSIATAALAAWGAVLIIPTLIPKARLILAAMALGLAGLEALAARRRRKPDEPTHSLGALTIVLFAHQLTDGARFLIFAIAVASAAPLPAGLAGALGGAVLLAASWTAPEAFGHPRARTVRRIVGAVLVIVAILVALHAFGKV